MEKNWTKSVNWYGLSKEIIRSNGNISLKNAKKYGLPEGCWCEMITRKSPEALVIGAKNVIERLNEKREVTK